MSPFIEVVGLTKGYSGRRALADVSFVVHEGEIFGLLGPNGAGKTTLLSILATLLQPDEGQVFIGGFDLRRDGASVKPLIGFVPQELALYPTLSAWDNLAFFGRVYGLRGKQLKAHIAAALEAVGLQARAHDAVRTFSGGMKRRLNIAAGIIHQPRLLLLDEPTVGVDPQSRNFIFEHIERLQAEGMTIIYTTHYMEEAERLCDRVAIMDEGTLLALDTPKGLVQLLGGGIIYARLGTETPDAAHQSLEALPSVLAVSQQHDRFKLETRDASRALLELVAWCNERHIPILSLEVLEPNLESVFLHLTGKRLRD